ncbi:uncharacterized protein PHACADRAFT_248478, partial [Phanerochaete carnosa HHB-10118-sp]
MSFKVHQSVLGLHSAVFLELFDTLDKWSQQLEDGCPIIQVTDHGPDLARLLLIIYGSDRCVIYCKEWM